MRFLLALVLVPGLAAADPDSDRCAQGEVFAKKHDLPRAALYLEGCNSQVARDLKPKLRDSQLSSLEVITHPDGMTIEVDALPGETFPAGTTVWIPAGLHHVRASLGDRTWTQDVTTEPHKGSMMIFETHADAQPKPARSGVVDFIKDDDGNAIERHDGQPENIKHDPLMSKKLRGIPDDPAGPEIADPLALHESRYTTRPLWLGARLGAGMFDDAQTSARAGFAFALVGRYRIAEHLFIAARTDWSRRGGNAIDVLGASAGIGTPITDDVALTAQLRGDLRLASSHDNMPVSRTGIGAALAAELALPSTPLTLGLRFEQAFTELVPGARDRAVLAELGVDWR